MLRPLLDALAPEEPAVAGRRVRLAAVWMAISSWLLPAFAGLGTQSTANRASFCIAFVAAAVGAHYQDRHRWARVLLGAAASAAALLIALAGRGALWGLGFAVFAALTLGLTHLRNRFVRLEPPRFDRDPLPPHPGTAGKVLNAYGWTGISILFMLRFVGQAMVVPTGSMQPTIMGARSPTSSGDHLFVDEFSYNLRDPRRWEIVVFKFPLLSEINFVKRVIGLPGEHVEIRDGDIWVNGSIARKPPIVQATMWRELFPRPNFLARAKAINDGFQQEIGSGGSWTRVSETETRCVPGKEPSFAFFNAGGPFTDLRIAVTAVSDGNSEPIVRITTRGVPVTLELADPTTSQSGEFRVGAEKPISVDRAVAWRGAPVRIEVCVADGEAWALIDGHEVARAEVPAGARGRNRVEIGASGGAANFRDVYVGRDIVYASGGGPGVYDVPKDGFFFLGDNVEGSEDSRKWVVSEFTTKAGEVLRAAPSIISETGGHGPANVAAEGPIWKFRDVDCVPREVPREGTKRIDGVPWPFARRSHLIGRAILVFWPWKADEAGFRPRLLP